MLLNRLNLLLRVAIPLVLTLGIALVVIGSYTTETSKSNIVEAAKIQALNSIDQYKTLRGYYTKNIVKKVKSGSDMKIHFEHKDDPKTIPLPATLIQDLSSEFAKKKDGLVLKLYSPFPFPNRADRKIDDFGSAAIAYLQSNPDKSFVRQEAIDGKEFVRVAIADRMVAEGCVNCHNAHPDTPKNDWKLGDIRGILEVSSPIDSQIASTSVVTRNIILISIFSVLLAVILTLAILRKAYASIRGSALSLQEEASTILSSSSELNSASQVLSSSSHEQAAAVQENLASVTEISSMVDRTDQTSTDTNNAAKSVASQAREGVNTMSSLVEAMQGIKTANEQLEEISQVIKTISDKTNVINDIVFKTQLLAFNASIEAARAGQHGRGFAVVAEEVGNLAQLSGNASADIKGLIESSQKQVDSFVKSTQSRVEKGQEVTAQAKNLFDSINASIESIRKQVEQVSEASNEQKLGINQVSDAMGQIDESTRSNNEVSLNVDHLSTTLRSQSENLSSIAKDVLSQISGSAEMPSRAVNAEEVQDSDSEELSADADIDSIDADDESFRDAA